PLIRMSNLLIGVLQHVFNRSALLLALRSLGGLALLLSKESLHRKLGCCRSSKKSACRHASLTIARRGRRRRWQPHALAQTDDQALDHSGENGVIAELSLLARQILL